MLQKVFAINRGLSGKLVYTCVYTKPNQGLSPEKHLSMRHNAQNGS